MRVGTGCGVLGASEYDRESRGDRGSDGESGPEKDRYKAGYSVSGLYGDH